MSTNGYVKMSTNPLTSREIDPVNLCVGNTFFTPQGIDGSRMDNTFCESFMGQRCANSWDPYCESYVYGSNYDQGGFIHINKNALNEMAKKKYCRMSSAPGTNCAMRCQSFVPQGAASVQICDTIGGQNWLDTKNEYDLGGNFPQSSRLNPISPLYLGRCPEVCDASNPEMPQDSLGPDDPVLNMCIKYDACGQVLNNLAYNLVKNNQADRVTNPNFKAIVNMAKLDRPLNPNLVSQIATTYGLPSQLALGVLRNAKIGGVSNQVNSGVFGLYN